MKFWGELKYYMEFCTGSWHPSPSVVQESMVLFIYREIKQYYVVLYFQAKIKIKHMSLFLQYCVGIASFFSYVGGLLNGKYLKDSKASWCIILTYDLCFRGSGFKPCVNSHNNFLPCLLQHQVLCPLLLSVICLRLIHNLLEHCPLPTKHISSLKE